MKKTILQFQLVNKIEDLYNKHAVKIISNGIEGSGCIIQPTCSDYSFIFTAKHCLTESNDCKIENVQIFRFNDNKTQISIKDIFLHSDLDIAIIKIEKIAELSNSFVFSPQKGEIITIYGYPHLLKGKEEQRQNIKCEVSFNREAHFELISENIQFTFENSTPETIKGFSGSGIFVEDGERLFIVGILTRLKAGDGAYSSFCATNIDLFDELLTINGHPSLKLDDLSNICKDYNLINDVFSISYNSKSEPYYQKRTIDTLFLKYLRNPKNVWISGLSGVGKTILILRNLKITGKISKHIDLTCSQLNTIEEYFEYINHELIRQCYLAEPTLTGNVFDKISDNLCSINDQLNEIIIFVDEVPISDKIKFFDFLSGFINISERYSNLINIENRIKWIICTRIDPEIHLKAEENYHPNKLKAKKNFIFKNFEIWNDIELSDLLYLLQHTLNFSLSPETQNEIKRTSKGLPGVLKSTIERVLIEDCSIQEAIRIIKSENY